MAAFPFCFRANHGTFMMYDNNESNQNISGIPFCLHNYIDCTINNYTELVFVVNMQDEKRDPS